MILLKHDKFQLDLSKYGVSLTEINPIFEMDVKKFYSFPFTVLADQVLLEQLGLVHLENISGAQIKFECNLLLPEKSYHATLYITEVEGYSVRMELKYGDANLEVYSTELKNLPWPIQLTADLNLFAQNIITQSWPDVGYNFPMVYYPDLADGSNYERFEGFANYFINTSFVENELGSGEEGVINRNVMVPFPYLLEILKFGYESAGLKAVGNVFENETLKKALYIPKNYLEKLDASQYIRFSFDNRDSIDTLNGQMINVYEYSHLPTESGTHKIKIDINLPPVLAEIFILDIFQEDSFTGDRTLIKNYTSYYNRVELEDDVDVVIESADLGDSIIVRLKLRYTQTNISEYNNFEIFRADGQVNVFPNAFSLSNFMPDKTFGEFVGVLKNWLNLEIEVANGTVFINFVQDNILNKPKRDHRHLELPRPKRKFNGHRFYKLKYANEEQVFYNKDGQIFSELDDDGFDLQQIEMEVIPAIVEMNKDYMTAVAPEDDSAIRFCLYDGLVDSHPLCNPAISQQLSLKNVFALYWEEWLRYRVNSFAYSESFECSVHDIINLKELSYKYNQFHIIKELRKKYLSESRMSVEIESETF